MVAGGVAVPGMKHPSAISLSEVSNKTPKLALAAKQEQGLNAVVQGQFQPRFSGCACASKVGVPTGQHSDSYKINTWP